MWNPPLDRFNIETSDDWTPCKWNKMYSSSKVMCKLLTCVWLFVTPWTTVHGVLQAKILEWETFPFSRGSSQPSDWTQVSCMQEDSLPTELTDMPQSLSIADIYLKVNTQSGTVPPAMLEASCLVHWVRKGNKLCKAWASLVAGDLGLVSGGGRSPGGGHGYHSSILAWRIPWREEPGGLQSMGSQSQTRLSNFHFVKLMQHCVKYYKEMDVRTRQTWRQTPCQ